MITAVIIAYNEEEVISECLESLSGFADSILVIDSNSTDKTTEIAKKHNAKIISHNLESFAQQRNFAKTHVKTDWIFYLDADERLTSEFKKEALEKVAAFMPDSNIAGYFIKRKTYYFGKNWGLTDKVQRLFYTKKLNKWFGKIHETPDVTGEFETINSKVLHFTHRNLSQMVEKTNKWSNIEAELRFHAHHPQMSWWRFPRVMMPAFFRSYISEKGYRNGTAGVIESIYQAYSMFITYAKLWELQRKK